MPAEVRATRERAGVTCSTMAPRDRLAALWINSLVFPIFWSKQRAISSASWSIFFFKARKRSPRVLMAKRDTLERRLVTLGRDGRGTLQDYWTLLRTPEHAKSGTVRTPLLPPLPVPQAWAWPGWNPKPRSSSEQKSPIFKKLLLLL